MIAIIPSALAIYGGETWIYHFDNCNKLRANITGNLIIHNGEYTIHNDCNNVSKDYWICNCSDNFKFNISFEPNAVNNYTLNFNYDYSNEVIEETTTTSSSSSGSSGGGGSSNIHWDCENWSNCINGNFTRYCYNDFRTKRTEIRNCTVEKKAVITTTTTTTTIPVEPTIEENVTGAILEPIEEPKSPIFIIILSILLIIIVFALMFWKYSKES